MPNTVQDYSEFDSFRWVVSPAFWHVQRDVFRGQFTRLFLAGFRPL